MQGYIPKPEIIGAIKLEKQIKSKIEDFVRSAQVCTCVHAHDIQMGRINKLTLYKLYALHSCNGVDSRRHVSLFIFLKTFF